MSEIGVRKLVARLVTDEDFKKEYFKDPKAATEKSGYSLTEDEIKALEKMKPEDIKFKYNKKTGPSAEAVKVGITAIESFNK
jgi:hypothetical protein